MYRIIILFVLISTVTFSYGQSTYNIITFEDSLTQPNAKLEQDTSDVLLSGTVWKMPGVYLGTPDANDFRIDSKSARIGRYLNSPIENGYLEMQEDYLYGFEYFGFVAAMYGSDIAGKLAVYYSIDSGNSWVGLDTFDIAPNATPTRYECHEHILGKVRFKIEKLDTTNSKINIDSIYCFQMLNPGDLEITSVYPTGRTHPSVKNLVLVFNQHIDTVGASGVITLMNLNNNTTITYGLNNPNLRISGDSVIISNVDLLPSNQYYVHIDSMMFFSALNQSNSPGIYGARWYINVTLEYLDWVNEDFGFCDQWDLLGIFKQYSVLDGSRRWNCEIISNNTFITMTGNNNSNTEAVANEDWLVSYLKFDFNGKQPTIKFKERKEGVGDSVFRHLRYSNDFNGYVNAANWTHIMSLNDDFTDNNWKIFSTTIEDVNISNQQVYLAIVYENRDDNLSGSAWKWSIDDLEIMIDTNTHISRVDNIIPSCYIIYPTTRNEIFYVLYSNKNLNDVEIEIFDINGRLINNIKQDIFLGNHAYKLDNLSLLNGVYVLKVKTPLGFIVRKFIVSE